MNTARGEELDADLYDDGITGIIEGVTNISVRIKDGVLMGVTRQGILQEDYLLRQVDWFLGVPYAKPPVGALRFKKPEKVGGWEDVREARMYGSTCPMFKMGVPLVRLSHNSKEDCLYLNVFTPLTSLLQRERITAASHQKSIQTGSKPAYLLPVMFFIHGGSYEAGSGNVYVGDTLAQFGVVVVTINYRLGMLGFLSAQSKHLRGNWGLHDQIAALWWVKENIGFFGGDANRVTVFGNSAGASSVGILSLSPLAKGLFKHAIIQSGSPLAYWSYYRHNDVDLKERFKHLAYLANCSTSGGFDSGNGGRSGNSGGFGVGSGGSSGEGISSESGNRKGGSEGSNGGSENKSDDSKGSSGGGNDSSNKSDDDDDIKEMVECLRGLKEQDLSTSIYNALGLPSIKPTKDDDIPCIDGEMMVGTIEEAFDRGLFHVDKLMIGLVSNEWSHHLGMYTSDYELEMEIADDDDNDDGSEENEEDEEKKGELYKKTLRFILHNKLGYTDELVELAHFIYFPTLIKNASTITQQYIKFVSDISFLVPSINYATLASNSSDVYFYLYDHHSNETQVAWKNNYHSIELNYIFGSPYRGNHIFSDFLREYTQADKEASFYAMKLWTNFAKTGNPNEENGVKRREGMEWSKFNEDTLTYANISLPAASQVEHNLRSYYVEFWNKIAPRINNLALEKERNLKALDCGKKGGVSNDAVYKVAVVCLLALVAALSIALCSMCLKSQLKDSEA